MPTRDAAAYAILTVLLLFVAVNLQAGWVYAVDALLIGLALGGWASTVAAVRPLPVSRTMPGEVFEGERMTVTLSIGPARWPRFFIRLCDAIPGLEAAEVFVASLGRRAVVARYETTARRRGIHRVDTLDLHSEGATGLFRLRRTLRAPGTITVFPRYAALSYFPLPGHYGVEVIPLPRPARMGVDVAGVRDFREGDDPSRIHWRSTARRGHLVVREFEREAGPAATLLIDTRSEAGDAEAFEDLIRAAASVAHYVTQRGQMVRIAWAAGAQVEIVTAGWTEALHALAAIDRSGSLTPAELRASLPPHSPVVVFSADADAVTPLAGPDTPLVAVVAEGPHRDAELLLEALGVPVRLLRRGEEVARCLAP